MVAKRLHGAVYRGPGETDGRQAAFARRLEGRDHVWRAPRSRNGNKDIAWLTEAPHLPLEDTLEAVIVADCGQDRGVDGKRDRRQWIAIEIQTRQELAGDVLGIGGAAAVAGDLELMSGAKCGRDDIGDGLDGGAQFWVVSGARQRLAGAAKVLAHHVVRAVHVALALMTFRVPIIIFAVNRRDCSGVFGT